MQPDELVKLAASKGWEAALVVFFAICCLGAIAWLGRALIVQSTAREQRMAARIDKLEDDLSGSVMEALKENTKALLYLTDALKDRPCLETLREKKDLS